MKKIKFLMIAMLAFVASMSFVACSDDDDDKDVIENNYTVYQKAVNQTVKSQKKNSKVKKLKFNKKKIRYLNNFVSRKLKKRLKMIIGKM